MSDTAAPRGRPAGRDSMGYGLAALSRIASTRVLDTLRLRRPVEHLVRESTKHGFRAAGAASRTFPSPGRRSTPARLEPAAASEEFSLEPTDEQQMIVDTVAEFATEQLRPAAAEADEACAPPEALLARAGELGIGLIGIPEQAGGFGAERGIVTGVLVAEALARGDMGLAVAALAPTAVSTVLAQWGDGAQQARYLPAFTGEHPPVAALALAEHQPLFDPRRPRARARRTPGGYRLDGVKALVPRAGAAELFVVSAELEGYGPALFVLESGTSGVSVQPDPSMGLRGAAMATLHLDGVALPARALLADADAGAFADVVRLSRLAWCALAAGTGKAVLDYVIPYVNERTAFGEPISHRQGVAFQVSDIAIELESIRLVTLKAAARAERGESFAREVALARSLAAEKGMFIGNAGVALLGGHGYTKEHPVERWYRDLRAVGLAEGAVLV